MRINFKNEKERKRQVDTEKNLNEKMKQWKEEKRGEKKVKETRGCHDGNRRID